MKLTEIVVDNYRNLRNLRLPNLSGGLNVVYGERGAGKTDLAGYVRELVLGGSTNPVRSSNYQVDAELFDNIFSFSSRTTGQKAREISMALQRRLNTPVGDASGNEAEYNRRIREIEDARVRLAEVQTRIDALEYERRTLSSQVNSTLGTRESRLAAIDREISSLSSSPTRLLDDIKAAIAAVDAEISQVRIRIENAKEVVAVPAPAPHNPLMLLYQRLDDLDGQIRRWRSVHSDIQQQRVRLKDEMLLSKELTLDSDQHPYHRARNLLTALEKKVGQAEVFAKQYHADIGKPASSAENLATNVEQICGHMRDDIYSLCDELGRQFKTIRHRAAAAELKQLRRCYNEMTENIERLVNRRESVIAEIRVADPAGADAIAHGDQQFCNCAQHEGYLQARRRFVGEIPQPQQTAYKTIQADPSADRHRLQELENTRRDRVSQLVAEENRSHEVTSRLQALRMEREQVLNEVSRVDHDARLAQIESELARETAEFHELRRLVDQQGIVRQPSSELLSMASGYANRFTRGHIERVWLTPGGVETIDRRQNQVSLDMIDNATRGMVIVSLCMAAINQLKGQGVEAPLLIAEFFETVEPTMIENMFEVISDFSKSGHQVILLTSDRGVYSHAANANTRGVRNSMVFELPQTRVSPGPIVTPERSLPFAPEPPRQPEFLTPFTIRHAQTQDFAREYPMVKYPPVAQIDSHEIHHFETIANDRIVSPMSSPIGSATTRPIYSPAKQFRSMPPYPEPTRTSEIYSQSPISQSPISQPTFSQPYRGQKMTLPVFEQTAVTESTDLRTIDLVDSIHLGQLSESGIASVNSLLELVPANLSQTVLAAGITPEQIDRWQAQAWLMICVPGLSPMDARILAATGITEPEQLDASNGSQLLQRIQRFLNSPNGSRLNVRGEMIDMNRVNGWMRSLDATRSSWRQSSGYSRRNRWRQSSHESRQSAREPRRTSREPRQTSREPRHSRAAETSSFQRTPRTSRARVRERERERETFTSESETRTRTERDSNNRKPKIHTASINQASSTTRKTRRKSSGLKFYLELDSHIEAAPSIGPKTAERFEQIGVSTVRQFLDQTAESMASKIQYKRLSADVIRQWQHHARLVCRIPNLRGHDAQLLVACGVTEPEDLAVKRPENLFNVIGPFSKTKEGLKIIRNGKEPDLEEVTDWINWAGHTRSLQAA